MSTLDFRDLPEDRLATTDKEGNRLWIIPARVRGVWKTRKTYFHILLLLIFVLTPWLRINGSPVVLFDIMNRQFVLFGKVFASHDAPLLFFVFGVLAFALIIATALWGRIWCGWACPQTVFIEQVFRRIETLTLGNRASQLAILKDPLRPAHIRRNAMKWLLFILVSLILSHTFIAYFVSWESLLEMMGKPPGESWTVFLFVFIFAGIFLFDFAWFREQFCIIMCPYGRFQSVLMDQNSVTVTYDYLRGEPRKKGIKKASGDGDCIDCFKCVSVCPTGIDIRRGTQLECIGCTACIDACDEVMEKVSRPKGLIRYAALSELEKSGKRFWRPRIVAYMLLLGLMLGGLLFSFSQHESFYVAILRQNQRPYVVSDSGLINNFKVHIKNSSYTPMKYKITMQTASVTMAPPLIEGEVAANGDTHRPFFVTVADWKELKDKDLVLKIIFQEGGEEKETFEKVHLVFPK